MARRHSYQDSETTSDTGHWAPKLATKSHPLCKYLGKLYIDRSAGDRPGRQLFHRALGIIQAQAPRKNKIPLSFVTTPDYVIAADQPPCLLGISKEGTTLVRVPIAAITSAGCMGKNFFYVTAMAREGEQQTVMRYWVHAFSCKSAAAAETTASLVIEKCEVMRARRCAARDRPLLSMSTYEAGESPAVSFYTNSPHSAVSMDSNDSSVSSVDSSPTWRSSEKSLHEAWTTEQGNHEKTPSADVLREARLSSISLLQPTEGKPLNLMRSGQSGMEWSTPV